MEIKYKYKIVHEKPKTFFDKYWSVITDMIPWILTIAAVVASYISLHDDGKWKKTEFLSKEYQRFVTDKNVINFRAILYNDRRYLEIIPGKMTLISRDYVSATLDTANFTETINAIEDSGAKINLDIRMREITDSYLQYLAIFQRYIKADVFSLEDVKSYFKVDMRRISDTTATKGDDDSLTELQNSLKKFTAQEKYIDAKTFIDDFSPN